MPIFVTGGTGFLGVNLVRLLVERGQRVRVLIRRDPPHLGLESDLIEFVKGDVTDRQSVHDGMRECSHVYHLAAWVQISPWGWKSARAINVEGTRNVCAAAMAQNVTRMVHTSSIATTGVGTLDHPSNEDTFPSPAILKIPYYGTKLESESVVHSFVEKGLDVVIVNPTYVLGPWDVKPSSGRLMIHAATDRVYVAPRRGGINYVDVRQAAKGHLLAMEKGRTGRRYLLGGENLSFRSFFEKVASIAGAKRPIPIPQALTYPFAAAGSLAGRLFPALFRDINLCSYHAGRSGHYVISDRARDELGYEVTPIAQAIADGLGWFVDHGYMKPLRGRLAARGVS